jgi:hypothetical protein
MQPAPRPSNRRFSEPFRWILLGAVLVFVSGVAAGAIVLAGVYVDFTGLRSEPQWFLIPYFALALVAPVGSFVLLVGLARAVRRPRAPASVPPSPGGPVVRRPSRRPAFPPFHIALAGAVLNLIGGLATVTSQVARFFSPPSAPFANIQSYLLTWTLIPFVTGLIAAVGSFLAFVGVGLAVRDGLG